MLLASMMMVKKDGGKKDGGKSCQQLVLKKRINKKILHNPGITK